MTQNETSQNSYPEPTNTEQKDREQSDSLSAENNKNGDKVLPTTINDIVGNYIQDGQSLQTAYLWAIADTNPALLSRATEKAIETGFDSRLAASTRAAILTTKHNGFSERVDVIKQSSPPDLDERMAAMTKEHGEDLVRINARLMPSVRNGSTAEAYQDARSIEALKDKLAQPARWLAGVACTAVLGGGAALGFHLLGVNSNMSIETRTNTTVAGGVTVGIIGGISGVSIAGNKRNTARFARRAARRKLALR